MKLSHLDERGRPRMVDVGDKPESDRTAVAEGAVRMSAEAFEVVAAQAVAKGDVLAVAEVAGTMGAKRTGELIPLCHPLPLSNVEIDFQMKGGAVNATCSARTTAQTGVEMEALAGVAIALLTIYDMCKAIDNEMKISDVRLVKKEKRAT